MSRRFWAILAVFAALALPACSKGQNASNDTSTSAPESAATAQTMAGVSGASVYSTNCSSCHQANGQGAPGAFPPLAGNPVVSGDKPKVIHIVKYGLTGQVSVKGQNYNGQMPAWAGQLSDAQIAAVLTYLRSTWGNSGGAVTTAEVDAVKQ